jgi:hypothetical protein
MIKTNKYCRTHNNFFKPSCCIVIYILRSWEMDLKIIRFNHSGGKRLLACIIISTFKYFINSNYTEVALYYVSSTSWPGNSSTACSTWLRCRFNVQFWKLNNLYSSIWLMRDKCFLSIISLKLNYFIRMLNWNRNCIYHNNEQWLWTTRN